jgi:hypothetical protein
MVSVTDLVSEDGSVIVYRSNFIACCSHSAKNSMLLSISQIDES